MMSIIGTRIWGSSSLGVTTMARSPRRSEAMTTSGVSLDWMNALAILPEMPVFSIGFPYAPSTMPPSTARSAPLTTILSPALTPERSSTRPSCSRPVRTKRKETIPPPSTA